MALTMPSEDVEIATYIIASRHGEYDRTISILSSLATAETVSPAEFSMSVHHGLAGLLSIHAHNRGGHVAVSAGGDTFCCGLMEAALCLSESPDRPVLLLYYDGNLPDIYEPVADPRDDALPLAAAFLLRASESGGFELQYKPLSGNLPAAEIPGENQVTSFIRMLLSDAPSRACAGDRMEWNWVRVC